MGRKFPLCTRVIEAFTTSGTCACECVSHDKRRMADGNGRRLLGLDNRVLQLNVHLQEWEMPPPNRAVVIIRNAARSLRIVVKSLFQRVRGRRAADTEGGAGEEKTTEKALDEYRQTLQNTFGNSERTNDVVRELKWWIDGT